MRKKKIIITGGHLTPALAVIDELIRRGGWEVYFLGRKYASEREKTLSVESQIITDKGIWFYSVTAGRFPRLLNRYAFLSALKLPIGFIQALYLLVKIRPDVILSFGGYLSVPVIFWGWVLGVPGLTHEQTAIKSLATKINAFFVRKIAVSWPQSVKDYPKHKVILTGNPIRREIFQTKPKLLSILKFSKKLPLVLVTGGNQGAHVVNLALAKILPELLEVANVFHQCGHLESFKDFETLTQTREKLPPMLKKRYHVRKFVSLEEMGTFLKFADLVVARSGANTLTEIAALGKPALFIPMPWNYKQEQTANAQMLVKVGLAKIVSQIGFNLSSQAVLKQVKKMLADLDDYQKNAQKAQKMVRLDAAQKLVDQVARLV